MKRKIYLFILLSFAVAANAQVFEKDKNNSDFDDFRKSIHEDFDDFRSEIMKEYINFVRAPWKESGSTPPQAAPKDIPVPPIVKPAEEDGAEEQPVEDVPTVVEEVLVPVEPAPQPQPVEPVKEVDNFDEAYVEFSFFGTDVKVRFDINEKVTLEKVDENSVADALERVSTRAYNNMLVDCLATRRDLKLSDWAYINFLKSLAEKVYGNDKNSATLLTAYLYMKSGYQMRLASYDNRLYMLYASKHLIYEKESYMLDGNMYYGIEELPARLRICNVAFENEKSLSLLLAGGQGFNHAATETRVIKSAKYPDISVTVSVNKNLLDFYSTYPTSMIGDNMMTRWAMYANTPLEKGVADEVYPQLKSKLEGLGELDAVNRLLDFVQTGYTYEYDDKVWGKDRIFFPDEGIFYPYNDCDDRSVIFSRLVRDPTGLDVAVVMVPGHILTAVRFNENVKGQSITVEGKKYILCEPTCVNGAPVGWADIAGRGKVSVIKL